MRTSQAVARVAWTMLAAFALLATLAVYCWVHVAHLFAGVVGASAALQLVATGLYFRAAHLWREAELAMESYRG